MYIKKPMSKIILRIVIVMTVIFLASCKGGNKSPDQDQLALDSINRELLASNIKQALYPLPTPFEITKMLDDIGAVYLSKNLNNPDKVDKYITENSKAINIGIYAADLAYASTYQQQQDIQTYLTSIKSLADQLGIAYDYEKLLSEEYKAKFENKDSLTSIVSNTIFDTYQFLDQKSNPDLAVNMITGLWVELMYLATNISENSYNYSGMVNIIAGQKSSYEKVLDLLASRSTNADIKSLESKLVVLKPAYDKVDAGLSQADYDLILKTIKAVRNSLI
jgi:hypothetical protein